MKILVVGSGGREDAIIRSLARQPQNVLHAAPGNPGMARFAKIHPVDANDGAQVAGLAQALAADLVVIGPEAPLVAGVADAVRKVGIACFGPSAPAAQLEGSKAFAKGVMDAAGVPTAQAMVATSLDQVDQAMDRFGAPYVIKDDGLAAGKGVVVTNHRPEAQSHAQAILASGHRVVIEDYLDGPEVSLFCITDGKTVVPLAPAQDFKRAHDDDQGPNTGGMGAYSPLPWAPEDLTQQVIDRVAQPTVDEMARRGTPFAGVLYCGLALTQKGLRVVEFNARFGDPETQVVLARLVTPLADLLLAAANGTLAKFRPLTWSADSAVTVVVAAQGYPGKITTGVPISGIEAAERLPGVAVLQAGTATADDGRLVASGGRILSVVGTGPTLGAAREWAYAAVDLIELEGSHHRRDIAAKAAAAA